MQSNADTKMFQIERDGIGNLTATSNSPEISSEGLLRSMSDFMHAPQHGIIQILVQMLW